MYMCKITSGTKLLIQIPHDSNNNYNNVDTAAAFGRCWGSLFLVMVLYYDTEFQLNENTCNYSLNHK